MNETKNKVANKPESLDVMPVIQHYVKLKQMEKRLQEKIKAAYDQFAQAATAVEADGMKVGRAKIQLSRTPYGWEYPTRIIKAEKAVKEAKAQWQESHDPDSGGEPVWKVVTNV
jgi:hypothetical protein